MTKSKPTNAQDFPEVDLSTDDFLAKDVDKDVVLRKLHATETRLRQTEGHLSAIFSALPDLVWLKDPEGIYLACNPTFERFFGAKAEVIIGKTDYDFVDEALADFFLEKDRTAMAKGSPSVNEEWVVFADDGHRALLETIKTPIYDAAGHITGVLGIARDITQRKLAEEALRESEEKMRDLFVLSPLGIALTDMSGRYIEFNEAFRGICGYPSEELLTLDYWTLTPKEYAPQEALQLESLANTGRYGPYVKEYRQKSGKLIPIELNGMLITGKDGNKYIWSIVEDISARITTEAKIRDNLVFSQTILNSISDGLHGVGVDGTVIFENSAAIRMLGWKAEEMTGKAAHELIHHTRADGSPYPKSQCHIYATLRDGRPRHVQDEVFWRRDGTGLHVDYSSTCMRNAAGEIIGAIVAFRDNAERKRAEENLRITASVFDTSQEAILITDENNVIRDINPAFTQITGYGRDEVIGKNPRILSSGRQDKAFYVTMWGEIQHKRSWRGEVWNRRKNGEIYAEMLSISAICGEDGKVQRYVGVFSDISHIKNREAELSRVANYDALTGVPNRVLLADRMKQAIMQTDRDGHMMAVCYLDIDGFKPINDSMGHDAGDEILVEVGKRLGNAIRGADTVARLGGDEFVVLLLGQERGEQCLATIERLLEAISQPITVMNQSKIVTASVGVTIYPQDNSDSDTLLRHADQAMYIAKQSGRNRFHMYGLEQDKLVRDHQRLVESIRHGLDNNEFELHYQPKVNLRSGEPVGVEALIRWHHPEQGMLMPGKFLPPIEHTELISKVGEWVVATALAQLSLWQQAGLGIEVSINISANHLESPGFVEMLQRHLSRYPQFRPGSLQIEVLETAALDNAESAIEILEACRKLGVSFALDDFGTGYSSLSYLSNLPVDALKIDQSFVRDMLEDIGDRTIVQGVIALAKAFGRQIVAEGIENKEQYQMLLEMDCELGQGYGIARPMPAGDIFSWVRKRQSKRFFA